MQMRIFKRRDSSSRSPYARLWRPRILWVRSRIRQILKAQNPRWKWPQVLQAIFPFGDGVGESSLQCTQDPLYGGAWGKSREARDVYKSSVFHNESILPTFFMSKISQTPCPEPIINDQPVNFTHSIPRRPFYYKSPSQHWDWCIEARLRALLFLL